MHKRPDLGQSSDIAFLLILFFLVLATLGQSKALTVELPQQASATSLTASEPLLITLHEQGTISADAQDLSSSDLIALFSQKPHLHLSIEENTTWDEVVSLLILVEQYPPASLQMEAVP